MTVSWPAPVQIRDTKNMRFTSASTLPGYTITITDPSFLEYIAERIGIFGKNGVVSPLRYSGKPSDTSTYTVSSVKFLLVSDLSAFVVGIPGTGGAMAGYGDYFVDGDTLVVRVALHPEVPVTYTSGKYQLEDVYLRVALRVMQYARGISPNPDSFGKSAQVFKNIEQSIEDYLYPGIIPWPIRIEKGK